MADAEPPGPLPHVLWRSADRLGGLLYCHVAAIKPVGRGVKLVRKPAQLGGEGKGLVLDIGGLGRQVEN
jgi:hypothetical protein